MANIAKIFVIIVTYKGHRWYERCFTSLRNSEYPVQTIVVDNASNDGTVEYIREHFPEIYLIESKENLGFGRANNIGMRYALDHGCDYVFLLNQDAWVEPNTLTKLVDVHNSFPEYGILSPMHLTADKKHIESGLLSYLANCKITDPTFVQDLYFSSLKEVYTSNYINAAAWLLPRNTLETIGGFDPIFYHYEEDDDYLNRVLYHGLKVGIVPAARMVHDHRDGHSALSNGQLTIRRQQYLLVRFTNLNKQESCAKYQCYQLRKVLGCLVRGHWQQLQMWWQDFRFLCGMKERIIFSRNQNQLKQSSWL
jgi:GT2 family glycosyltransferase